MTTFHFVQDDIVHQAKFSQADLAEINKRRRLHNRLGFAYQLAFVRLSNRFPKQEPLEISEELLMYVGLQLDIPPELITEYEHRRQTIVEHRQAVLTYLGMYHFGEKEAQKLREYLFSEACRLEETGVLLVQARQFLKEAGILYPADERLKRLIMTVRKSAREYIFSRVTDSLSTDLKQRLDDLLETGDDRLTLFQTLKQPPGKASPAAMLRLTKKLEQLRTTTIHTIDLSWLNNNYQRVLAHYAETRSADRIRQLESKHRYAVLTCFLQQTYQETVDNILDMFRKLMIQVYNRARQDIDEYTRKQRRTLRQSLDTLHILGQVILDETVSDADLRQMLFEKVDQEKLITRMAEVEIWLTGKYSHVFNLVIQRFSYLRRFSPALVEHLQFREEKEGPSPVLEGVQILQEMNRDNRRKLPDDVPLDFIPKKLRGLVEKDGEVSKAAWECALLTAIKEEIKAGNIFVKESKRFGRFDNFFIGKTQWETDRVAFFKRANLPVEAKDVPKFLTNRLAQAYDHCLKTLPENTYAQISNDRWQLSVDPADKLDKATTIRLEGLKRWLAEHMRPIKLPDLLIEVDNDLRFTTPFMTPHRQQDRTAEQVCQILATVIAHGCNVGPHTMAQLTDGITYAQIKRVTDWQLSPDSQRQALAQVVNAISNLAISQTWGKGQSSSSDGQRFRFKRKVLQQTYSHRFNDYALEFYSFVADNYAPFYSAVIECTDRDAAYVLDGLLYNESDLALEEHYTDTHGYTEINFAAFAMLGRRFAPRISKMHKQRIYRIDKDKDYGALTSLVTPYDRQLHLDWICDQWDRMGQFYASLQSGHTTASTALKRLASYSSKNQFYRANRELGRVFKTEHILTYMSDPVMRQRIRRGLLKGEEIHALARQVAYGKQGRITARDLQAQRNTSGCLTLIMACIIFWQAKEINRVILECEPEKSGIDLSLLTHISPIQWENVILYGAYILNQQMVRN